MNNPPIEKPTTYEVCDWCDGRGFDSDEDRYYDCKECNGTGYVPLIELELVVGEEPDPEEDIKEFMC